MQDRNPLRPFLRFGNVLQTLIAMFYKISNCGTFLVFEAFKTFANFLGESKLNIGIKLLEKSLSLSIC